MEKFYIRNHLDGCTFSRNGFKVMLPAMKDYENISIALVETEEGRDNYCSLDKTTIFYYIIDGNGEFVIHDERIEVVKDDLIEICPKNKYTYKGKLKMLEILPAKLDENEVHEWEGENEHE